MSDKHCIIIGASHAAAQLAPSLRQEGWQGRIIVIGDEHYFPYKRPPLSKTFLAGEKGVDELLIRAAASYEKADIEFRTGHKVTRIDRQHRQVELDNGKVLTYDKLALAIGARVRKLELPGSDLKGVFYLRNVEDAKQIQEFVAPDKKVVIVGGGYIGLETAAMLRSLKMKVTVLEATSRVLNRVTAPEVSAFYTRVHREEGVEIITDVTVTAFSGDEKEKVQRVNCAHGRDFEADLIIIGVGVLPNVELAEAAGLKVENGIIVDSHCLTNDPDIVAAGDCTRHFNSLYQTNIRLESVQNAVEQAKIAAATVCGNLKEYNALPWFWSDQYDLKLQIAGLSQGYDDLVIRGDIDHSRKFAAFYLKDDYVIAVDAVNKPQEFLLGKRIIAGKMLIDKERLADDRIPMKELIK